MGIHEAERIQPLARSRRATLNPEKWIAKAAVYVVLAVVVVLMGAPFLWIVSTSFKSASDVFSLPPQWPPSPAVLDNYATVWQQIPFGRFYLNSIEIAGLVTLGQLVTCSLAAYAFARLHFRGRDVIFAILLASLMVPIQVTIIPLYVMMRYLQLINTPWSLILPGIISPVGIFLLRQFFLSIPGELVEAARIDGAGHVRILTRIFVPLSVPALATLAIFTFNYYWNDFFRPLIFLNSIDKMTIPLGLVIIQGQYGGSSPATVMAGVCLALAPVVVVFLIGQRYLIEGITLTGLKG
jgi:ABC-type glycerol-3-phosphate transport system permease component